MSWWFATAAEVAAQQAGAAQYGVGETAGNLSLLGGSAHITVSRKLTSANLSLTSGAQTITKFVPIHQDGPNMQLVGGSSHFTVGRAETAAHVSLLGGVSTVSTGRYVAHAGPELALAGGTAQVTITQRLTAADLQFMGGDLTVIINIAEIPSEGVKQYTTDEQPGNLAGSISRREPMRLSRRTW